MNLSRWFSTMIPHPWCLTLSMVHFKIAHTVESLKIGQATPLMIVWALDARLSNPSSRTPKNGKTYLKLATWDDSYVAISVDHGVSCFIFKLVVNVSPKWTSQELEGHPWRVGIASFLSWTPSKNWTWISRPTFISSSKGKPLGSYMSGWKYPDYKNLHYDWVGCTRNQVLEIKC